MKYLRTIDKIIAKGTGLLLVVAVLTILFFGTIEIIFRWMGYPLLWAAPLIRHLVFASVFLGGILATGEKKHIAISIVQHHGPKIERITMLFSFLILLPLVYGGWKFVQLEAVMGQKIFWGIHSQFLVMIIPLGMGLMAYRFFYLFVSRSGNSGQ